MAKVRVRAQRVAKSVSSLQQGWALAGLSTLLVVSVVASSNLNEIYNSQKDFVAGSLLSLAGFCFGKAFSRTQEQKALELIRGAPTDAVSDALEQETRASLHDRGVFETLTRLERDLQAGSERITEYYDAHCRNIEHYSAMALLRVALDDLGKALWSAMELRAALNADGPPMEAYQIDPSVRLALIHIARDYREAIGRRDQAYDWYRLQLDNREDACWDVFAVMTSDMLKGERLLSALLGKSVPSPPEEYLRMIDGYVRASIGRAQEFMQLTAGNSFTPPKVFDVMLQDLNTALSAIDHIEVAPADHPST
ncbi:MAG TPA: hypothetical protein VGJ86_07035 [Acidimicrobiales bacterium]|jgi:hypothetical protein